MEACVGAHHLSRKLQMLGHDARLMPAKYVRSYSKGQNDFRDAEAIADAVQRPTMKFVATKTADRLDLQALHRVRNRLVGQRTGVINQIRAFLLQRGIAVRQGLHSLRFELAGILATRTDVLSPRMLLIVESLVEDWRRLDPRIEELSNEIETLARQDEACQRLMPVPGIGPIISSRGGRDRHWTHVLEGPRPRRLAWTCAEADIDRRPHDPRQYIKARHRYLRALFVQAAWVVLVKVRCWERYGLSSWIKAAKKRLQHNVLAIALANKLARIASSTRDAPLRASRRRRRCPDLLDARTMRGAVKAQPGSRRARRPDSTTAGLDRP
jgi:transposase